MEHETETEVVKMLVFSAVVLLVYLGSRAFRGNVTSGKRVRLHDFGSMLRAPQFQYRLGIWDVGCKLRTWEMDLGHVECKLRGSYDGFMDSYSWSC